MKTASIKVNFFYSALHKVLAVVIPIVITPYLARVLEADGNGSLSFVASISSYFILFSNLGIETYGQRLIAIHRDDSAYLKKCTLEISILRLTVTLLALFVYGVCFVSPLNPSDNLLYAVYALPILAVALDFTWFFQGVENYRVLAISNIITRFTYVALVFLLVKGKGDLTTAALLAAGNTIVPFALSMPFLYKYFGGKIEGGINPIRHLKDCFVYLIPTIAIQIYTVLDKTMIGVITHSDFENGYYEEAEKLIKMPLTVIMTLNTIIRARIAYYYGNGEEDKIKSLVEKSANLSMMLIMPITFGFAAVIPTLVPVYLGAGYEKCVLLMYALLPLLPIITISNLYGSHYYTPCGKQKTSNIFLIAGALFNAALNTVLIYFWQSLGAAIASVCAELLVTTLYAVFAAKFFSLWSIVKLSWKYFLASAIMFGAVFTMEYFLPVGIWYLVAEIAAGVVIYPVLLAAFRSEFFLFYTRMFFRKIFRRRNKEKKEEGDAKDA